MIPTTIQMSLQWGDKVLVNPHSLNLVDVKGTRQKLLQQRIGPFLVMEKINLVVYHLCLPAELQMHPVINIRQLTQYNQDEANQWRKLKDQWTLRGECREYLVQWKGYRPEHDTFEPESHLRNAFLRLGHYKEELPSQNLD